MAGARRNEAEVIQALSALCSNVSVPVEPATISAILALVKSIVKIKPGKAPEAEESKEAFKFGAFQ